jgi:hypothetical protein
VPWLLLLLQGISEYVPADIDVVGYRVFLGNQQYFVSSGASPAATTASLARPALCCPPLVLGASA